MKHKRTRSLRYGVWCLSNVRNLLFANLNNISDFYLCFHFRRWRRARPTTSWSSSATPAVSSAACTPWTPTPRTLSGWPAWARGRSPPTKWSPSTNTAQTGSSSAPFRQKQWGWVWTPSPSPAIYGKEEEEEAQEEEEAGEPVLTRRWLL